MDRYFYEELKCRCREINEISVDPDGFLRMLCLLVVDGTDPEWIEQNGLCRYATMNVHRRKQTKSVTKRQCAGQKDSMLSS